MVKLIKSKEETDRGLTVYTNEIGIINEFYAVERIVTIIVSNRF